MAIKLVAVDLDGTLLDSKKRISAHTKSVIEQKHNDGVLFAYATGRTLSELIPVTRQCELIRYAITANGASIFDLDTGKILHSCHMTMDDVYFLYDRYKKEDIAFEIIAQGMVFSPTKLRDNLSDYGLADITGLLEESRTWVDDIEEFMVTFRGTICKVNIFFKCTNARDAAFVDAKQNLQYNVTHQLRRNLEFNHPQVNKGAALEMLASSLELQQREVMALGDNMNDIEMLQYAGRSVAMLNSIDAVKTIADYFTKSNDDDGVAFALEHFVK